MDKKISNKLKIFSGWIVMIFILFMSSGYSITTITGSDVNTTGNVTGDWIFGTNANITGLYYGNGSALTDIEFNLNQTQTTFEYNMSTPYDTFNFNQTQTTFEYNMTITTFAYNQTNIFDYNQTATNLSFVPYTGASDNVDLGNNNLTLGDVITFRLGEIIDNILDGWIQITGSLNVTGDIIVGSTNISKTGIIAGESDFIATGENDALNIRATTNEGGSRIVFWADPTSTAASDRIGFLNTHGENTPVGASEYSFYVINGSGFARHMMKFYARNNFSTQLVFVDVSGISSSSGQIINLGEDVGVGTGGVSGVRLHANLDLNFSEINNVKDINSDNANINSLASIKGRSTGNFDIVGGTNSRDIVFKTRNSTGSQITRLTINGGDNYPDIQIGDGTTQTNITLTSPDGTEFTCGVNNGGTFSCS